MSTDLTAFKRTRLVAVVRLNAYDWALEVAQALVAGGISVIEFTLTGRGAVEAIARMRAELGDNALIGAGTVIQTSEVAQIAAAGAQFVVTPIFNPRLIDACHAHQIPIICGALTPTEMQNAYEAGAEMIKVFPARQVGAQYLRDVLAPLPHLRLVPTGGINARNIGEYLQAGAVAVGLGSNLVSEAVVAAQDWAEITRRAQECVSALPVENIAR